MANDCYDAFVRCEFRTHRTGVFRLAKVVTPDKFDLLTVDAAGIIDFFKFQVNTGLDIIAVCSQIARIRGSDADPYVFGHGGCGHAEDQCQSQDQTHKQKSLLILHDDSSLP